MEVDSYKYSILELTPELQEKLCAVALEVMSLLIDKHHLGPMQCYVVLDNLRTSLMTAEDIERVDKIPFGGKHSQA
jgi:ribosome biogenesis SPOUT family RNA methylase Rps3